MIFIHKDELFQYGFSVNEKRVLEEWLFARKSKHLSKTRTLFQREYCGDGSQSDYEWEINEAQLPGEKEHWKRSTRDNALFISTAVQLNSQTLVKPFEWIQSGLQIVGANARIHHGFTASLIEEFESKAQILRFIEALDLHITDFRVESTPFSIPDEAREYLSEKLLKEISDHAKDETEYRVYSRHESTNGDVIELSLDEESDGTKAIFGLVGPIFDVLRNGLTLVVDELSNSLHPLALKGLVSIFQDPRLNPMGAQLIFTSHETSIISKNFMHKDQIWLVAREDGTSTTLTPLSDYKIRELETFQRSYLGGKFGALPNVRSAYYGKPQ